MKRKVSDRSRAESVAGLIREDILKWDPPLFAFDYTADQWKKIRAALSTRATPGFYDLEKVCKDLRVIACCYRFRAANHEGSSQRAEYLNQQWLTVADAASTILDNIDVSNVPLEEVRDRLACWEQAKAVLCIARKHLRGNLDVDPLRLLRHGSLPAEVIQFLEEHLRIPAEERLGDNRVPSPLDTMPPAEYAQAFVRYLTEQRRVKGLDPKEQYLFEVLDVWCSCGGKDTYTSDHSVDRGKRVKGPLTQFFAAVTGPVCGGSTDSLSGARGILARYRKHKKRREQGQPPGP
jgi:hypothetical protein